MHRVPVGSPAELQGFLTALDQDKHLAMDFWAVMGKMSDEGPAYLAGRTLNARMLEVVVEAVTGLSVADILASGEKPRHVMAQLVRLLAGEDLNSPEVVDDLPGDSPAGVEGGEGASLLKAEPADVESRKPVVRAESSISGPVVGSASSQRPFRNGAGEVDRSPVELRPLHRVEEETPRTSLEADEADSEQASSGTTPRAASREGVKRTTLRWPYEPAPEPFTQQPPVPPQREAPRAGAAQSGSQAEPTRAAFVPDALSPVDRQGLSEEEQLERLRLVHWVLENFPASKGGAAAKAEADYYEEKLNAAEIFARYAQHRSRASEAKFVEQPAADGSIDTPVSQVLQPAGEVLPARVREVRVTEDDDDPSIRVPLSDWEDDDYESSRQSRRFMVVLSVIVAGGILVGLLMAQVHVVEGWQSMRAVIQERVDAVTHRDRSSLNIPNDLVVDPPPAPVAPPPPAPVRRVVRPPEARTPAAATARAAVDRPLVRVLPAPNDRIDPVPGGGAGVAYDTVLSSDRAAAAGVPVVVPGSVMAANLVTSRLPAYPDGARAGVDSRVVLQAIILKNGAVGHLRVVSGDSSLRGAAADAVAKWRYRPYLVNDVPVEVSTTVTVDFSRSQ